MEHDRFRDNEFITRVQPLGLSFLQQVKWAMSAPISNSEGTATVAAVRESKLGMKGNDGEKESDGGDRFRVRN